MMKKIILRMMITSFVLFSLIGCGKSDATGSKMSKDGELSDKLYYFNWAEYVPQEVLDNFEKEFGVEVVYDTYTSNQEMLTKVKSGTVSYDIVGPTEYIVERMINEDLILELDKSNIPNLENIEDDFLDQTFDPGNKYSVPYLYGSIGIAYNEKEIEAPTSWEDLWNPDYKDHVSVQQTPREVYSAALQLLDYSVNDPTEEQLVEAKDLLVDLDANVLKYDANPAALLISAQTLISQVYSGDAAKAMSQNPDISFILPEEGGILWMDNLVIPKTAENKYTAEVFLNYLLRPEVSKQITDEIPNSNPNKAAKELMSEEVLSNPASYPAIPENAVFYQDLKPEILQEMNRLFKEIQVK